MATPSLEPDAGSVDPPLVSCIMPTRDRRPWVPHAIRGFLRQDYPHLELVVVDDGEDPVEDCMPDDPRVRYVRLPRRSTVGAKRNIACAEARGEIIAHWDDDDWYAPDRIRLQVREIVGNGAELCGASRLLFYQPSTDHAYRYDYSSRASWVHGSTQAYKKSLWARIRFPDVQVGEDVRFAAALRGRGLRHMRDVDFCVCMVHTGNTSFKNVQSSLWTPVSASLVHGLLGDDLACYRGAVQPAPAPEAEVIVSCIMPTRDRRPFVPLALASFRSQSCRESELIIVDDGADPVGDLAAGDDRIRYVRLPRRASIGEKRNIACQMAKGRIIAHWDDDDWYAPDRLRYQAEAVLRGEADITGLEAGAVLALHGGGFWSMAPERHQRMFVGDVHGGTLVYRKQIFDAGVRYPSINLAEDAALLRAAMGRGSRLLRLQNPGVFVYTRHGKNAWRFEMGKGVAGWSAAEQPATFPDEVRRAYEAAAQATSGGKAPAPPPSARATVEAPPTREGLVLLVGFYEEARPERRAELLECLRRNAAHPWIDAVHVFLEDPAHPDEARQRHEALSAPKVTLIPHGRRLTFSDLFRHASEALGGRVVAIANADVYFDDTLSALAGYDLSGEMLCLSRWDVGPTGESVHFARADSQDVWIFRSPAPALRCDFHLGVLGCDGRVAYEAERAGLRLHNPSVTLRAHHLHRSNVFNRDPRHTVPGPKRHVAPSALARHGWVTFREEMGYRVRPLAAGVSSHTNDHRVITSVPAPLAGKMFTQVVSCRTSPLHVEWMTRGTLYVLVGTDWYGHAIASELLSGVARRESDMGPLATSRDPRAFEVWSIEAEAGHRLTFPVQVMLVADRLEPRAGG